MGAAVPFVAAERFAASGLKKYAVWRAVWELQRREDEEDFPQRKFRQSTRDADFAAERRITASAASSTSPRNDSSPIRAASPTKTASRSTAGPAGTISQRARALASLYQERKTGEGWQADRLTPMLAGLLELIPWVKQWHNEPDAEYGGLRMGDYFEQFLDGECQALGLTREDLRELAAGCQEGAPQRSEEDQPRQESREEEGARRGRRGRIGHALARADDSESTHGRQRAGQRPTRAPGGDSQGRLRPQAHRGRARCGDHGADLRGHADAARCVRQCAAPRRGGAARQEEPGRLPPRLVRLW